MNSKNSFTVNVNDLYKGNEQLELSERTIYAGCTGCITNDNKIKPYFVYDIVDDRCVKNKTTYQEKNIVDRIITYEVDPITVQLESCINTYNSMYNTVNGRYIYISKNSALFKLSYISIHGRNYTDSKQNSFIFTRIQGGLNYATKITSSLSANLFLENNAYTTNDTIILDLGLSSDIGFIDIIDFAQPDGTFSLSGATLEILDSTGRVVHQTTINANHIIPGNLYDNTTIQNRPNKPTTYGTAVVYRRIAVNRKPVTGPPVTRPTTTQFEYSSCNTGCFTDFSCTGTSGCLIKDYIYNHQPSGRCFKPTIYLNRDVLNNIINDPTITNIPTTLVSCSSDYNTTTSRPNGRFIRIQAATVNTPINLLKFYITTVDNSNMFIPVDYTIIPYIFANKSAYDKLLSIDIKNNTTLITTGQAASIFSYIQLDLGSMKNIQDVYVETQSLNTALRLLVINEGSNIISDVNINA